MTIRDLILKINMKISNKEMEGKFLNSEEVCSMAEAIVNRYLNAEDHSHFLYADLRGGTDLPLKI